MAVTCTRIYIYTVFVVLYKFTRVHRKSTSAKVRLIFGNYLFVFSNNLLRCQWPQQ